MAKTTPALAAAFVATITLATASSASAADLGGNCCADLEERIAELEATTARKGNRKVSLTVSGWVNEAIFLWDDGVESNAYVGTNGREQSRVRFVGDAKINSDWSAGYHLEIGVWGGDSRNFSQEDDNGTRVGTTTVRRSSWNLKSKTFGKFLVGKDAPANYHLLDDANSTNTRTFADPEANNYALGAFRVRNAAGKGFVTNGTTFLNWTDITNGVQNDTVSQDGLRNVVRYDSPEFAGFTFTASWGEDDIWGTTLTYKNTLGEFDVLAKVGYAEDTDDGSSQRCSPKPTVASGGPQEACEMWGAAGTVQHKPTGLYVFGAYGGQQDNREEVLSSADDEDSLWFVQAGIERKWVELGKTTLYAQYQEQDGGSNVNVDLNGAAVVGTPRIQSSEINYWGLGAIQKIENASMDLYVTYTHADGDFTRSDNGAKVNLEAFDSLITGARVQF